MGKKIGAYLNCLKVIYKERRKGVIHSFFVCIRYRQLVLQLCPSRALQLILLHFLHMELPERFTVNTMGSCSESLHVIGGNVLVLLNTSSRSRAEEQDGA